MDTQDRPDRAALDRLSEQLRASRERLARPIEDFGRPAAPQPPAPPVVEDVPVPMADAARSAEAAAEAAASADLATAIERLTEAARGLESDSRGLVRIFRESLAAQRDALDAQREAMETMQRDHRAELRQFASHVDQALKAMHAAIPPDRNGEVIDQLDRTTSHVEAIFASIPGLLPADRADEIIARIDGHDRTDEIVARIDATARSVEEVVDRLHAQLPVDRTEDILARIDETGRVVQSVAAGLPSMLPTDRTDEVIARIDRAAIDLASSSEDLRAALPSDRSDEVVEHVTVALQRLAEAFEVRLGSAVRGLEDQMRAGREDDRVILMSALDERIEGLARLSRSDHQRLAESLTPDDDVARQALRAIKELQAAIPIEVAAAVNQRIAAFEEPQRRALELLYERVDLLAQRLVTSTPDANLQAVMDRMGDALHTLATMGRTGRQAIPQAPSRIDLDLEGR